MTGLRKRLLKHSAAEIMLMVGVVAALFVLVLFPVGALFYGALQSGSLVSPNREFTLSNLNAIYLSSDYIKPIYHTMLFSVPVTIASGVLGVLLAWLLTRTNLFFKSTLELLIVAPLLLSPFIGAIAWMALLGPETGFINAAFKSLFGFRLLNIFSLTGVIFVMTISFVPYAYLFVAASINSMDPSLEDASRTTGAGIGATLRRITFPLSLPAILSSAMFVFVLSAEMFSIPGVLGMPAGYTNLASFIYRSTRQSPPDWPMAAAAGTLLLLIALGGTYLYQRYTQKAERFRTITGKGYRPRITDLGKWRWPMTCLVLLYAFVTTLLPYGALVLGSFMKYNTLEITRDIFTLENYTRWFGSAIFKSGILNTIKLGLLTPPLIILLALLISYILIKTSLPARRLIDGVSALPIAVPGVIFGIGLVWFYFRIPLPIYGTILIMIVAYLARYLPHGVRTISTTLIQVGTELEEAARVCGANPLQTTRTITVPLLKGAMLYISIMVFMLVTREVSTAVILYVPKTMTLSVLVWDVVNTSNVNAAYALGAVQTVLVLLLVGLARVLFGVRLLQRAK